MPLSPETLVVNVDGMQSSGTFPTIEIVAPEMPGKQKPIVISGSLPKSVNVTVAGVRFSCFNALCTLPPLAHPKTSSSAVARVGVARWMPDCKDKGKDKCKDKIVFTVISAAAPANRSSSTNPPPASNSITPTGSSNTTLTSPGESVQLVTGGTKNVWEQNPEVYLTDLSYSEECRLYCDPEYRSPTGLSANYAP